MYGDPSLIRKHRVPVYLNDKEAAALHALCALSGEQPAVVLRTMAIRQALEVLHGGAQSLRLGSALQGATQG